MNVVSIDKIIMYGADIAIVERAAAEIRENGTLKYNSFTPYQVKTLLCREDEWKREWFMLYVGHEEEYILVRQAFEKENNGKNVLENKRSHTLNNTNAGRNIDNDEQRDAIDIINSRSLERIVETVQPSTAQASARQGTSVQENAMEGTIRQESARNELQQLQPSLISATQSQVRPLPQVRPPIQTMTQTMTQTIIPKEYIFTPQEIDNYFEEQGIVGEDGLRRLLVYSLLSRAHVGIESLSGAGKSRIMDAFLGLFPQDKLLVLQQSSEKALFNNPMINQFEFWVITEFQKISNKTFLEIVKNISEGTFSRYTRTNNAKDGVDNFEITPGKTIYYTLAISNDYFKNKDKEFSRRFIVFYTDISAEQNERVIKSFAESTFARREQSQRSDLLKQHILECLSTDFHVRNPFLLYLADMLPRELRANVRVRSFFQHYEKLISGCTIYHHRQKEKILSERNNGRDSRHIDLFSGIFDNIHIAELYGQMFYDNIVGISVIDRHVLNAFEDTETVSYSKLLEKLEQKGFYDKTEIISDSLKNLEELRFIRRESKDKNGNDEYTLLRRPPKKLEIDWFEALKQADEHMMKEYPDVRDRWYQRQQDEIRIINQNNMNQSDPNQSDGSSGLHKSQLVGYNPAWNKVYEEAGLSLK